MSLPANSTGAPQTALHYHFRNICKEFRKTLGQTQEIGKLDVEFDRFINVSRGINWSSKPADQQKKVAGEKALSKVIKEYKIYITQLHQKSPELNSQGLMDALSEVEQLAKSLKS